MKNLTIPVAEQKLKKLGVKKRFKPYIDDGDILLRTRKSPKIKDGSIKGCEIDLYSDEEFRIWTSQKKKAMDYSKRYDLKIRELDKEAELFVSVELADDILPEFGAKITRTLTPEQREKSIRNLENARKHL